MTKQILDIELTGIDPNRPGSEGVAEAVGVDLANPSPQAVTSEHNVHVVIAKGPGVKGLEEVAFAPAAEVVQVGSEGSEVKANLTLALCFAGSTGKGLRHLLTGAPNR